MKYLLCLVYLCFSITGLIFMKLGSMDGVKFLFEILGIKFSIQSLIGYMCYGVSFLLYTIVITKFDLSYIIPILGGIVNIIVIIAGVWVFQEKITIYSVIGSILIIIGIFLINVRY